jgi:subtilase family serine protease
MKLELRNVDRIRVRPGVAWLRKSAKPSTPSGATDHVSGSKMIASTFRSSPLTALALATTLALTAAGMSVHAGAINNNGLAAVAHATALRQGDAISVLSNTQPMHIVVALKLRNRDQLDRIVAAHQTMTHAQFNSNHAPTPTQAQAVANYLIQSGFKNVVIAPNQMLVSADGTAGSARAAFLTSFSRVQTREGRVAFANNSDAYIPAALKDSVLSVIGLQDLHQPQSFVQGPQTGVIVGPANVNGHNPVEFSSIYGGTGVATAAGVTVGIITEGDVSQTITDLNTFTANNGLATVTTQTVNTGVPSGDTNNVLEWNLDSQAVVGMSGGQVGKIIFYNASSLTNPTLVADLNTAMTANAAKIINVSLGECETYPNSDGSAAAADQIFQAAAAQGQTFSIATGDAGANECSPFPGITPSWPASSPYVVAVSGTMLNATTTTWTGEVVWNNLSSQKGATGGSPSTFEPKPSWENALVPGTKRGVADVAFNASQFSGGLIVYNGAVVEVGGTSMSAPIFAGLWARVIAVKGTAVGFAAPLLYQLPATDFHDITFGNNNGETAGVGYDFASGRGSVILNRAITHIGVAANVPPVANFSYTRLGLSANFTDSSTDSDGTIASHAWTFGDGRTSTAANPSHSYAAAGTYNVTETVTDNGGASNAKTLPVTVGR